MNYSIAPNDIPTIRATKATVATGPGCDGDWNLLIRARYVGQTELLASMWTDILTFFADVHTRSECPRRQLDIYVDTDRHTYSYLPLISVLAHRKRTHLPHVLRPAVPSRWLRDEVEGDWPIAAQVV